MKINTRKLPTRLLAILLAVLMCFGMGITALAETAEAATQTENEPLIEGEMWAEETTVIYDPQPATLEEIQVTIDVYNEEYQAALESAKPHWQYEVAAELMPEGYRCEVVTGDTDFGADYYTFFIDAAMTSVSWGSGGIIVESEAEFRTALADTQYMTIYLGTDITMSSSSNNNIVVPRTNPLVINGTDPREGGSRHTYTDYNDSYTFNALGGACSNIVLKDININIRNYYGIFYATNTTGTTVTLDNVTGSARQVFYGRGTNSILGIKDSDITLTNTGLGAPQELVENAGTVRFEGKVTVTRDQNAGYDELFYLTGTGSTVEIADSADVILNNNVNMDAGAVFYTVGNFRVGTDALFTCFSTTGFADPASGALGSVMVGTRADVRFICTKSHYWGSSALRGTTFQAEAGSNFLIQNMETTATYGAFHFANVILNNPESFIVLNPSARAIGTNTCNLTATSVSSIRYYPSGQIADLFNTSTYAYTPSRTFTNWWAQISPFSVTANTWSASAPTITSDYDGDNVPTASVTVMPSLASSNFSASSSVSGMEIYGTIYTLTYSGNGADSGQVPASDAGVPDDTIAVQGNTGNLARTGYVFTGWNTLPDGNGSPYVSGESITLRTDVTLYAQWAYDSSQTASINVEYYFDKKHDPSLDITITPQILETVTQSDVVLATTPAGYTLSATPTDPSLPQSASSLNRTTIKVYYVTDISQVAYTLTIQAGPGGTITAGTSGQYAAGTIITVEAAPNGSYIFSGWTTSNGGAFANASSAGTTFTMPANDVTITANFTGRATSYTLTYNANGGAGNDHKVTGISPGSIYMVLNLSDTGISRTNYAFTGWNTEADGSGTAYAPGGASAIVVTSNTTLYAQWEEGTPEETGKHLTYLYGYPDDSVRADNAITRAEAAAVFYRLLTNPGAASDGKFSDVASDAWYTQEVNYLAMAGIMNGYPDGTFKPETQIKRAEFAAIAARFDNLVSADSNIFSDVSADHWAISYIHSAYAKGWINGYSDGTFRPENSITRAEVVTIVNAMLGRKIDDAALTKVPNPYKDIITNHWAYADIIEASVSHEYRRDDGVEIWQSW